MQSTSVLRRLRIAHFFLGMMFFYGIEQVFLNKIIGDNSARAYVSITYIVSLIVFDVPTGIFADKFGRKRALLVSTIVQIVALLVLGFSTSLFTYIIGNILFGLFVSLLNGAAQAYLYDTLALEHKQSLYAKYQGSIYGLFLLGAGVANASSGLVVSWLGLRAPYIVSIIPGIIAFCLFYRLYEPPIIKRTATRWYSHLSDVAQEIRTHPRIVLFAAQYTIGNIIFMTIGEFGQIYFLSFNISVVVLGILWAIDAFFAAGGRFLAHRWQRYPQVSIFVLIVAILVFIQTKSIVGIGLFWLVYGLNETLANIAETEIQDETKSHIRATMHSAAGFLANICAVPAIIGFNYIYTSKGIHQANTVAGLCISAILIVIALALKRIPKNPTTING